MTKIVSFLRDESGAAAAEYAIVLALVGVAIVTALGLLGTNINTAIGKASTAINP